MKILIRPRRVIIQAFGWSLIDLDVLTPVRKPAAARFVPGHDPHSTVAAQVEQADEPPPGFGFCGGVRTIVARGGNLPADRKN